MKEFLKSLVIYPTALVGGLLVVGFRVVGWFLFLGSALMGLFWFLGELDGSGWTAATAAIVGLIFLALADGVTRIAGKMW